MNRSRSNLVGYTVKRLVLIIPVVIGVSIIVFVIMSVIPGDPVLIRIGLLPNTNQAQIDQLRAELGLNQPLYVQYLSYLNLLVHGNLGNDIMTGQPVVQEIMETFPRTLFLALAGMFVALVIGIPVGIYSAMKQNLLFDRLATIGSLTVASIPNFWLAIILILIFSFWLNLTPVFGSGEAKNLILPALSLGLILAGVITRFTRSSMLEVIRQDFIRTARSKGLKERTILFRHALRNSLIPIITLLGLMFGELLSGAFFVEWVFAYPGIGRLAVLAIQQKNYPVLQATVLIVSISFVILNLLVDIIYRYIDPRVGFE